MTKPHYVIIDTIGRAENVKDNYDWFAILDYVHARHMSAGGNTPLPETLLRDGKIIVSRSLCSVAWDYCKYLQNGVGRATKDARDKFREPET